MKNLFNLGFVFSVLSFAFIGCASHQPKTAEYIAITAPIDSADKKLESIEKDESLPKAPIIKSAREDLTRARVQVVKTEKLYLEYKEWSEGHIKTMTEAWSTEKGLKETALKEKKQALDANAAVAERWHKIALAMYFLGPFIFWICSMAGRGAGQAASRSNPYTGWSSRLARFVGNLSAGVAGFLGLITVAALAYGAFTLWSIFGGAIRTLARWFAVLIFILSICHSGSPPDLALWQFNGVYWEEIYIV